MPIYDTIALNIFRGNIPKNTVVEEFLTSRMCN